jgi:hypothetical protein
MKAKDHTGRNTVLKLEYFSGAGMFIFQKDYDEMNIHEKITYRSLYAAEDTEKRNPNLIFNR